MSAIKEYNIEELSDLILEQKLSYEQIGRMYGVTGNAIKKKAILLGIKVPKRRQVRPYEDFSRLAQFRKPKSFVNKISDEEFINIIESSTTWKEIGKKLGYSTDNLSSNVKDSIIDRCTKLNIQFKTETENRTLLDETKKELFERKSNWQSARNSIRRLAYNIYYENNDTHECAICGYKHHIDVAHIKAVSDFDDNATLREINDINNLIGLCPNHHWEYDHGLITLEQIKKVKEQTKIKNRHIIDEDK